MIDVLAELKSLVPNGTTVLPQDRGSRGRDRQVRVLSTSGRVNEGTRTMGGFIQWEVTVKLAVLNHTLAEWQALATALTAGGRHVVMFDLPDALKPENGEISVTFPWREA